MPSPRKTPIGDVCEPMAAKRTFHCEVSTFVVLTMCGLLQRRFSSAYPNSIRVRPYQILSWNPAKIFPLGSVKNPIAEHNGFHGIIMAVLFKILHRMGPATQIINAFSSCSMRLFP